MKKAAITAQPDGIALVVVESGCNLGRYPYDSTLSSSWANSLNFQLEGR